MLEKEIRQNLVATAQGFLGCKESDGSHRKIIDIYNESKPLARGYKMSYTDAWCACFVSVVALKAGLVDIIPKEVSCNKMIELYKGIGRWEESDSYVPNVGDIIFYDWDDTGAGDNVGASEHVGIVVNVANGIIKVIEGNMANEVGYRNIAVNGKYIRGYGLPNYASKATSVGYDEIIWNFLTNKGLNAYAVAGIVGNLYAESGLRPNNLQNACENKLNHTDESYTKDVDNRIYTNFVNDGVGYGLAQWTYWSRKQALFDFAKAAGASIGDFTMQLNFLWKELQSYKGVIDALKCAKSVPEASNIILTQYECPADQGVAEQTKRAKYGQIYYDKFVARADNSLTVIIDNNLTALTADNIDGYFVATLSEIAKLFPEQKFKLRDIFGFAGYPSIIYDSGSRTVIATRKSV